MKDLKYYLDKSLSPLILDENIIFNSVVCLIYIEDEIFFIHRTETMPTHKGDIAFVGGHIQKEESVLSSAFREFEEEVSLSREVLDFRGYLAGVKTSNLKNVAVCCFELNICKEEFLKTIQSNGEWSSSFFVSFEDFLDVKKWSFTNFEQGAQSRRVYFFNLKESDKSLWGMSASIIFSLFKNCLSGDTNNL